MTLKDINTSRFIFDPKKDNFVKLMHADSKEFVLNIGKVTTSKALIYLVVMYDPASELIHKYKDLYLRKNIAGEIAEFPTDKTGGLIVFKKQYESLMLGQNDKFNNAVAHFLFKTHNLDFIERMNLEFQYFRLIRNTMKEIDTQTNNLMKDVKKRLIDNDTLLFGGDELSDKMRNALYAKTLNERLRLQPEQVLEKKQEDNLGEYNPFGDYEVDDVMYYGKEI
jgi:hypothetical protein